MKRKIRGWILTAGILCFLSAVTGVYGYFTDSAYAANRFGVGWNDVEIREEFPDPDPEEGEEITKKASFVNTGPVTCYVRARLVFNSLAVQEAARLEVNTQQWSLGEDGYYYYQKQLPPQGETEELLYSVTVEKPVSEEEKSFDLAVYVETVQAEDGVDCREAFAHLTR